MCVMGVFVDAYVSVRVCVACVFCSAGQHRTAESQGTKSVYCGNLENRLANAVWMAAATGENCSFSSVRSLHFDFAQNEEATASAFSQRFKKAETLSIPWSVSPDWLW